MPSFDAIEVDTADATGVVTMTFGPGQQSELWVVWQVTVSTTGAPAPCAIYKGAPSPTSLITRTANGNDDSASGSPPVSLSGGEFVTVQWTGLAAGDVATAHLFYDRDDLVHRAVR